MSPSLATLAARGAASTLLAQGLKFVVQVASLAILARLLSPSDYGLFAMVVAVVGVGEVLRDFGLSTAAIQARELSLAQRRNLFWLNTAIGAAVATLVFCLNRPIAALYGDARLQSLTIALAFTFLLNGMTTQLRAEMIRDLRLITLNAIELSAQIAASVLAIALATSGVGFMTLAYQQLCQVSLVVLGLFSFTQFRLGPPTRLSGTWGLVKFGGYVAATQLIVYVSQNASAVTLGKYFGAGSLGMLNRAQQLCQLPLNQVTTAVTQIALPTLSKLQDDENTFARHTRAALAGLGLLLVPALTVLVTWADRIVPFILGGQWADTSPVVAIMAVGAIFQTVSFPTYWTFVATGRVRSNLLFTLMVRSVAIPVTVVAAAFGGLVPCAVAITSTQALTWVLGIVWTHWHSSTISKALAALGGHLVLMAAATIAWGFGARTYVSSAPHPLLLLTQVLIAAIWVAIIPSLRGEVRSVARALHGSTR